MSRLTFDGKADPRLEWAALDEFDSVTDASDKTKRIGLLITWRSLDDAQAAFAIAAHQKVDVPLVYAEPRKGMPAKVRRVWGLTGPAHALMDFVHAALAHIDRIELAAAVRPSPQLVARIEMAPATGPVLVGILDDGFAFANPRFRRSGGTRCLWLWDQDPASKGSPLDGNPGVPPGATFGYGGQWSSTSLDNALVNAHGIVEGAYRTVGIPSLRREVTHGTHVADLAAGSDPTDEVDRSAWDLVVVQFPQAGIDDPAGGWLGTSVLDGLHYVLATASDQTTTIAVNCSWGPQTGPHDGSTPLEVEFETVVAEQRALFGRTVFITLPAGNSYNSRAHASFDCAAGGSVEWMVPPDGATPAYLEVWWPPSITLKQAVLAIDTPDGDHYEFKQAYGFKKKHHHFDVVKEYLGTSGVVIALIVHPTARTKPKKRGPHGRWRLSVTSIATTESKPIHVYVARADHNMGARRRATASYLTDRAYEAARFVAASDRDKEVLGSAVRRQGTLNGIATGAAPYVAGGYSFADLRSASYTSSGPTRSVRTSPDYSCITDRSIARPGVHGSGVRGGTRYTLVGTSTAAPQLASKLVLQPPLTGYPDPATYDPKRDGAMLLEADPVLIGKA